MVEVLILGAGGHGQVVADILLRAHEAGAACKPRGYLDDDQRLVGKTLVGLPVLGKLADRERIPHDAIVVAIGDNQRRAHQFDLLRAQGMKFVQVIHPAAVIAPDVQLGEGVMVCAGVVVNTGTVIGDNAILNTGCLIDHHNQIGNHAHIAPGNHLGGEVCVGIGALLGVGAVILPRCRVGDWAVVGAGSVVIEDVPAGVTVVGNPARVVEQGSTQT